MGTEGGRGVAINYDDNDGYDDDDADNDDNNNDDVDVFSKNFF